MGGLIFFGLLGLWVWTCFALTRWCMRRVRSEWIQFFAAPVLFVALFMPYFPQVGRRICA